MENRFCRIGKHLLGVACLLSTCGVTYSCSDDYDLDETTPSFLGKSIYDELKSRTDRKFTTVIRLIDDLDYKDVLSKTGSKTLFVADDDAYAQFFENNTWDVKNYDQLSTNQKRILLNGSMLNNAYVLEMLTTIQGPVKNLCLRQLSALSATDSVPYFKWNELPNNLNNNKGTVQTPDRRYWDEYNKESKGGMYLALDKTTPMMTHFLQAQMNEKNILPTDVSFILGLDGTDKAWTDNSNRSFVYNAEVVEPDVTCLNGYYHVLDKVLVTPGNMAEEIRKNPDTQLFSAMLDRFSAPYYDATLTEEYKALHSITADSVFQKLYIASRGQMGSISKDPKGEALGSDVPRLPYDPGWNAYNVNNSTKEQDMGAMFVPSDAAVKDYFLHKTGSTLLENYATIKPVTEANLLENIYQIPQNILVKLIYNLMKESFNSTVPSKYLSVMNTAQDQMFSQYKSEQDFKKAIEKVLLANNGVVYVMNEFVTPPDYASVSGPVLTDEGVRVMNAVIHADDNNISSDYGNAPLRKFYSSYLLAMQSHFSLFVPTDSGLAKYGYVDPIAQATGNSSRYRYWSFTPDNITQAGGKKIAVRADAFKYDRTKDMAADGQTSTTNSKANDALTSANGMVKKQMLCDIVDQHIVVHGSDNGDNMIESNRNFYLSRSGAPVYIKKYGSNLSTTGKGMLVNGGFQIDVNKDNSAENDFDCEVVRGFDLSKGYGNGHTYFLNRPMQPTLNNAYQVMQSLSKDETKGYTKFFSMCSALVYGSDEENLAKIFKDSGTTDDVWKTELQKFAIFASNQGSSANTRYTANNTNLVRFFNNYRYTIFVPSDKAIDEAIGLGLPTLETIDKFVEDHYGDEKWESEYKPKAQAMVTCLINFLKYHFCDQSYFVDNYNGGVSISQTACTETDASTGKISFIPLAIKHEKGKLVVYDAMSFKNGSFDSEEATTGNERTVTTNPDCYNLMARDYELRNSVSSKSNEIKASSYVSVQCLTGDQYLMFKKTPLAEGFANNWKDVKTAKAFVKKFALRK